MTAACRCQYRAGTVDETHRRWEATMPEAYERLLVPTVFRPFALDLARRVSARSPQCVLELAAGTAVLTRELLASLASADVTASDLNPAMVAFGRRRAPAATWQEADASELPFEDGQFDMVACQFGAMFFPDKRAAFREARRVLDGGGRVLFNVWDSLETHDFESAVVAGLRVALPLNPPTFLESIPHGYADRGAILADLADAGLGCVAVESVTLEGWATSAADIAAGYCTGTPVRSEIEQRADLATVTEAVAREVERRLGNGPITGRMTAHVIEASPAA